MKTEAEMGGTWPHPRDAWSPRSWERQEGHFPGASGGSTALPHLDLRGPAPPGFQTPGLQT